MPKHFIYLIYTSVFALILIAVVPKREIRRLSIYGIIFGGIMDVFMLIMGNITGLFGWINYGPFGFLGIPIFSSISWAIYFILYFYFLPEHKPLVYVYTAGGIVFSVLYTNIVISLGVFESYNRVWLPLMAFILWFSTATWGFYKLTGIFGMEDYGIKKRPKNSNPLRIRLFPQPARKKGS
ncbi:hypothetical protein SAMN05660649_00721 [Desulfotomaculum arcticum]|uniref:Uncharacterized protein n=1 Tax=Desulfotruncus arcticus DSM 17038 TaxID=1121424 RepID=A0A1I2PC70_9FIRM|nr:hypothetical protein [Desulfotruncus arcticus]SFG11276.1 hypothetical protein SAMN05660649_00721 [Desulfotomaculum arcticum] [Desulfotruncus arcticus DSM 17038]